MEYQKQVMAKPYRNLSSTQFKPKSLADFLYNSPKEIRHLKYQHYNLSSIGSLPKGFSSIQYIDLSYNSIVSLEGLESLKGLKTIDLSNNLLQNYVQVSVLSSLRNLVSLNLAGNPIAQLESYPRQLLRCLPTLEYLDNQKINRKEREKARKQEMHETLLSNLSQNEKICIILDNLKSKLRLHRQLIINNFIKEYKEIDVSDYLQNVLIMFEFEIGSQLADWIKIQGDEQALTEFQADQQRKISDLTHICESLAAECASLFQGKIGSQSQWHSFNQLLDSESINGVDYLYQRLQYIRTRQDDRTAIQIAVNEGLDVVVERFRMVKLKKKAFENWKIVHYGKIDYLVMDQELSQNLASSQQQRKNKIRIRRNDLDYEVIESNQERICSRNQSHTKSKVVQQKMPTQNPKIPAISLERLLNYATFHREKKMKSKVFYLFKNIPRSNTPKKLVKQKQFRESKDQKKYQSRLLQQPRMNNEEYIRRYYEQYNPRLYHQQRPNYSNLSTLANPARSYRSISLDYEQIFRGQELIESVYRNLDRIEHRLSKNRYYQNRLVINLASIFMFSIINSQ